MGGFLFPILISAIWACCAWKDGSALPLPVFDLVSEFSSKTFQEGYSIIWGDSHLKSEGEEVKLTLDRNSGSGFQSQDRLYHGFFSAAIKLPKNYSAGVVTAFYTSNADLHPKYHDELDYEFLGVRPGHPYVLQTNIYGHGSTDTGREERFTLWFDPTLDYHHYSILWNEYHIVFFVDNMPIREMVKSKELGLQYPAKPMGLYSTIWDGSNWATEGGRFPVNYDYEPFEASYKDLKLEGCVWNVQDTEPTCASSDSPELNKINSLQYHSLTRNQRDNMRLVRSNYMAYSYCDDAHRYPTRLPECGPRTGTQNHKTRKVTRSLLDDSNMDFSVVSPGLVANSI